MTGRRATAGLCMLCALAFSALVAQGAGAATKGTTVFTCKEKGIVGGAGFSKAHCAPADAVASGAKYEHVAVAEGTTTEITGTSEDTSGEPTVWHARSTQAGVKFELHANLVHLLYEHSGVKSWLTNAKDPTTGEHYVHGEGRVQFTEVTVTAPANKGCEVRSGQITTNKLKGTSKGQGDNILIEPASGSVLAEFEVEGCQVPVQALNGLWKAEGSLKAQTNGATLFTTEAGVTAEGNLKLRGQKAGVEGEVTVKGTDKAAGDVTDTPLSPTTVETP